MWRSTWLSRSSRAICAKPACEELKVLVDDLLARAAARARHALHNRSGRRLLAAAQELATHRWQSVGGGGSGMRRGESRHCGAVDHSGSAPLATECRRAGALHFADASRRTAALSVLADNSVLHLNTDSSVTVRYSKTERLVTLTSGEAVFEVAHESGRAFRVLAGGAEVVALGTKFDVRLMPGVNRGHGARGAGAVAATGQEAAEASAVRTGARRPADQRQRREVAGHARGRRRGAHHGVAASTDRVRA